MKLSSKYAEAVHLASEMLHFATMRVKIAMSAAFLLHTLFGSFCIMPMAMAAEAPMPHDMDAMDEMMTPIAPMSHADCPDCPKHEKNQEPVSQSSCAGHCLSHASNTNPANAVSTTSQLAVILPAPMPIVLNEQPEVSFVPRITTSPPPVQTDTVVLTL